MKNMVKKIHYFWFGNNPVSPQTEEYIKSWKKYCPDYEIVKWDESNFSVNYNDFTKLAYENKKWAFVSDFARFYILYHEGGLCLDTDVELIKGLDDLIDTSFAGFESYDFVAPGLILYASEKHQSVFKEVLDYYNHIEYSRDIERDITSPQIFTKILKKHGLKCNNKFQTICGMKIYPMDFFQPWGTDWTKKNQFSENTRSIHHYAGTWMNHVDKDFYLFRYSYGQNVGKILFTFKHPFAAIKKVFGKRKKDA